MADLRHLGRDEGRRARRASCSSGSTSSTPRSKPATTYSGGMRRRLDLAMTLVGDPRIIFLDEPTAGLDPRSRRVMWDIVRDLVARRRHDLPHDPVPRGGRSARPPDRPARRRPRSSPRGRRPSSSAWSPAATSGSSSPTRPTLERAAAVLERRRRATNESLTLQVPSDGGSRSLRPLLDRLDAASIDVDGLSVRPADLDDVFLSLTGATTHQEAPTPMTASPDRP